MYLMAEKTAIYPLIGLTGSGVCMIRGIGTSDGIGMGRALLVESPDIKIVVKKIEDSAAELERYQKAKERFIKETLQMVERLRERLGEKNKTSMILQNQIYLINDIEMDNGICQVIKEQKVCAEAAVEETCSLYIKVFENSENEAVVQRVADIVDLKDRLTGILLGVSNVDLTHLPKNTIIVAKELPPSMTALMDIEHIAGIIAENGGETSHTAILAKALEIPAVLSVKNALKKIKNNDYVIADGSEGEILIQPDTAAIQFYQKKYRIYKEHIKELKKYINKETVTKDKNKVCLGANIGNLKEAVKAMESDAECIGLFRTEFLFMNGIAMPTEEEQFEVYKQAAVICGEKVLTIRTLDIGGDKDIPYMGLSKESNPFLGYRAIRFCMGRTDIFETQLRAILRAAVYGNIRIMLPMVTGADEIRSVKELLQDIIKDLDNEGIRYNSQIDLGIMIETPAACMTADILAKEVDFFSIGTNDLTQYMLAADRGNEKVAYLYSSFHPAVLRSIQHIIECAKRENIEVGMCGEAAAQPAMIPLLLAFGLDEYSVTAAKVLETRKNIASWTLKEAAEVTKKVMSMCTEKEVSSYLKEYIAEKGKRK